MLSLLLGSHAAATVAATCYASQGKGTCFPSQSLAMATKWSLWLAADAAAASAVLRGYLAIPQMASAASFNRDW